VFKEGFKNASSSHSSALLTIIIGKVMEKLSQWRKSFFEAHYGTLLKVAFRYVSTYEQAVEMTYQGFIRIFNEVTRLKICGEMKFDGRLSAWVKRIFILTLVDKIKAELNLHSPRPIPGDIWQEPGGEANLASVIIYIELIKILKGLPVTYRLVFNLHVIDGFSHAEIAEMLGITVNESTYNLLEAKKYCNRSLEEVKIDTDYSGK
jgi:RNA polymerase sigma factor (sigma-70 family)